MSGIAGLTLEGMDETFNVPDINSKFRGKMANALAMQNSLENDIDNYRDRNAADFVRNREITHYPSHAHLHKDPGEVMNLRSAGQYLENESALLDSIFESTNGHGSSIEDTSGSENRAYDTEVERTERTIERNASNAVNSGKMSRLTFKNQFLSNHKLKEEGNDTSSSVDSYDNRYNLLKA